MLVQKINPVHIFASSVLEVSVSGDNATVEVTTEAGDYQFFTKENHSSTNWEDSRW